MEPSEKLKKLLATLPKKADVYELDALTREIAERCEAQYAQCGLGHKGECESALACFSKILSEKPSRIYLWYMKGMCLYQLGRFEEARECFDEASKLDPVFALPYLAKGMCAFVLWKTREAIKNFGEVLSRDAKNIEAHLMLFACYVFLENEKKAKEHLKKALLLNKKEAHRIAQRFFETFFLGSPDVPSETKIAIQDALMALEEDIKT